MMKQIFPLGILLVCMVSLECFGQKVTTAYDLVVVHSRGQSAPSFLCLRKDAVVTDTLMFAPVYSVKDLMDYQIISDTVVLLILKNRLETRYTKLVKRGDKWSIEPPSGPVKYTPLLSALPSDPNSRAAYLESINPPPI